MGESEALAFLSVVREGRGVEIAVGVGVIVFQAIKNRRTANVRVAGISDPGYAFTIRLTTHYGRGYGPDVAAVPDVEVAAKNYRRTERTSCLRCSRQESPP